MRVYAALPCNDGPPMACCGQTEGSQAAPPPCHCSLSAVQVAPMVVEAAPLLIAPAAIAAAVVAVRPPETTPLRVGSVVPHARGAPLFVLFATFLN